MAFAWKYYKAEGKQQGTSNGVLFYKLAHKYNLKQSKDILLGRQKKTPGKPGVLYTFYITI